MNHANGNLHDQVVLTEHQEIVETLQFEKIAGSVSMLEVVRTPGNRKRLFILLTVAVFSMTMGNNVVTYYLGSMLEIAGVTDLNTQLQINIILSAWSLLCALAGTVYADKLGRRALALISTALATIFLFLVGGFSALYGDGSNTSGSIANVAMMFLFMGAYSFGWTPLSFMYPVEVLSYSTRATGMGIYMFVSNGIGLLITFTFPYAFAAIGWKTYMINAVFNFVTLVFVYYSWVETRGKSLEEIDELMDGEKHSDVPNVVDVMDGKAYV